MSTVPGDIEIHDCDFIQVHAFGSAWDTLQIHDCHFEIGGGWGVVTVGFGTILIHDNYFTYGVAGASAGDCIQVFESPTVTVFDNVFDLSSTNFRGTAVYADQGSRLLTIRNNLMIGGDLAIALYSHKGVIENNTIFRTDPTVGGCIEVFNTAGKDVLIRNNIIIESPAPYFADCSGCFPQPKMDLTYNSYWPPPAQFYTVGGGGAGLQIIDSANFSAFPMFVDDSLYQLQAGSPLIDAGDPTVLDVDPSRSDIGWTGGAGGIITDYPELPPEPPDSVAAMGTNGVVTVGWAARPEADLAGYNLYRGGASGFWSPGLPPHQVLGSMETQAIDTVADVCRTAHYVLTAFDSAGMESVSSLEIPFRETTDSCDNGPPLPLQSEIYRIYPNPSNSGGIIELFLTEQAAAMGIVRVEVFDLLGRRVATPVNQTLAPGLSSLTWASVDDRGRPLASGVYFAQLRVKGEIIGDARKFVVLK